MSAFSVDVVGARAEPYAAVPTLIFPLVVSETSDATVHAVALRCQIRIEPQRRHYSDREEGRLLEQFGPTPQWGDSLKPFLWTHVTTVLGGFTGRTEIDLPVPCSYDFEVSASRYLHSLDDGEVPLVFLFNGTVFSKAGERWSVEPVPWSLESSYRLPVAVWRELMDQYFPNSGWLRLRRDTLDALGRFKAARALPTWEQAIEGLLKEAGEPV